MAWFQTSIQLRPRNRGFHLVTVELEQAISAELELISVGLAHFFIQHTSASLTINENADPSVREDLESYFNRVVPENLPDYTHVLEGPDDIPAHIKSTLIGAGFTIPVTNGRLALGTWQGIYLNEHQNQGGSRRVVVTLQGEWVG